MNRRGFALQGAVRRLWADRRGSAAVEFALLLPVLLLLLAGLVDTSRLISHSTQIRAAAQAGADHARKWGWDSSGIVTAVTAATRLETAPEPRFAKACLEGGGIVETSAPLCASGQSPGRYVFVRATAPFTALFPWPAVIVPSQVAAEAMVRVT